MYKKLFASFIKSVENSTKKMITQQRNAKSFQIKVVNKNNKKGFEVEPRVMPIDTFFAFDVFNFVLDELIKSPTKSLKRGDGLKSPIGEKNMELDTIESMVAIKFYKKKKGQFVDRRISIIANILVESGTCVHGRGILKLVNLNREDSHIEITSPRNTPKKPISTNNNDLPEYLIENKNKIIDNISFT
jgi:hypothetical protein